MRPLDLPGVRFGGGRSQLDQPIMFEIGRIIIRALFQFRLWPVRTGRSLRGFRYRTDGQRLIIFNDVDYAIYVERNTSGLERTIRRVTPTVVRVVNAYLRGQSVSRIQRDIERRRDRSRRRGERRARGRAQRSLFN